jgi:single-stranded-DNA-specific exonuclease
MTYPAVLLETPQESAPIQRFTTASGLPWRLRCDAALERTALAMTQQYGVAEPVARILAGRGVALEDAADYLAPSLRAHMPDPGILTDMEKAAARVADALHKDEQLAVFGDYDVDGATSSALLVRYMQTLGVSMLTHIPDRMKEGYGPSIPAFDGLIDAGARVILTVDCGTLAFAPIAHAKSRGVDVIVLDHHTAESRLPEAYAVVNPNRIDDRSGLGHLAAVGVTFLFLAALNRELRARGRSDLPDLLNLLDLVALGTVADVVALTGLNRVFVAQGLKMLAMRQNTGLNCLMDSARMDEPPGTYHLGFLLGPRINAGGRVGEAGLGLQLLTEEDPARAADMAARLSRYNEERQAIEMSVLDAARALAETQANFPVMLLAGEGWHPGVIGIVAGRIKEEWQRPVAVVALENGVGKASARSVPRADFGAAIHAAHALGLIEAGGGHAMAAGFTVRAEQCAALQQFLCDRLESAVSEYALGRSIKLDAWISCVGATIELISTIESAGPYGAGNPSPRMAIRNAQLVDCRTLKDKHLRVILADQGGKGRLAAIAFNAVGTPLGQALQTRRILHIAGELKRNRWQGQESAQMIISDVAWDA